MGYIYKITNLINNKIYVGQTSKTIEERYETHLKNAQKHINRYLYDAMNHYGYDNFEIKEIEQCDNKDLDEREKYWIAYYDCITPNGYNMTAGGGGGNTWKNNPNKEKSSKKLSKSLRDAFSIKQGYDSFEDKIQKEHIDGFEDNIFDDWILIRKIKSGDSIDDISKYFGLSRGAICKKCKEYLGCSIKELRTKDFNFNGYVNTGGNYKTIDKDALLEMIKSNCNNKEICNYFSITNSTLRNKCVELFGKQIDELRDSTYSMHSEESRKKISESRLGKTYEEIYDKDFLEEKIKKLKEHWLDKKNPNYKYVDKSILYDMIYNDLSADEMADYFNISKPTLYAKIKKYFNSTLKEMRKIARDSEKSSTY